MLEQECCIYLSQEQAALIERLRLLRNQIRHFAVTVDQNAAVSLIARAYKFASEFVQAHLTGSAVGDPQFKNLSEQFSGFADKRLAEIRPEMQKDRWTIHVPCPMCLQPTLYADGERARCRFCGADMGSEEAAITWADEFFAFRSPKDEAIDPSIHYCPECGEHAFVNIGNVGTNSIGFFCFGCAEHGDYIHCDGCGELFLPDAADAIDDESDFHGPDTQCPDCWAHRFDSSD